MSISKHAVGSVRSQRNTEVNTVPEATSPDHALPPLHVGMLWHTFQSENLGVGALSVANSRLVGEAVEKAGYRPVLHMIGSRGTFDYSDECPYETSFTNIGYKAMANPLSPLHRRLRGCDIVFDIGGGDSFSDLYPWSRYNLILGTKVATWLARTPLILSPQTIGPFFTRRARTGAKAVMRMAQHILARDEASFTLLQKMGFASKSQVTADVAFALPFDAPVDKDARDLVNGPVKLGLNVSALLYRRDLSRGDKVALADDYPALVDAILDRFAADPRFEVHLVPHVTPALAAYEDDHAVAESLKKRRPALILPPRFTGPSQAKSYIANLDFFAGSRMHATIAAVSSGTAVLPLGYSRKFSGLFDSLGYRWNADLTRETNDAVLAKLEAALADLPAVRAEAVAANAKAQRRLDVYRAFLDRTIAELVACRA